MFTYPPASGYPWLNAQENDISASTHASTERAGGKMMHVETARDVCRAACFAVQKFRLRQAY